MNAHKSFSQATVPVAFITKNKQRIKQYDDTVYLNNGDEFEIELFNPTINKVLAKIELNGNSIGSGIVLRPGERVFLERYIDESKKFLFETYVVNGNNSDVRKAIANNGLLNIKFFNQTQQQWYSYSSTRIPSRYWSEPYCEFNNPYDVTPSFLLSRSSISSGTLCCADTSYHDQTEASLSISNNKNIETGRIEKGSQSNQKFKIDDTAFNTFPSWETTWKILPMSQKHITKEDLNTYCTNCGTKRKKDSFKFCPNCGTKF